MIGDAPDGVHQEGLAERRPPPRLLLQIDGRCHVDERQGDELGEPARLLLERPRAHHVARPVHRPFDGAEHDRDVRPQSERVCRAVGLQPLLRIDLVAADHLADLVVEDLGRRAGQGLEPDIHQAAEVVGQRLAQPARPLGDLQSREPVDVDTGCRFLHGPADVDVVVAVEAGVDAALQADLGGALGGGLGHPTLDLLEVQQVRIAS